MGPGPSGSRMRPQLCGCRHLCQYAAENGLDAKLVRLRDWCCICDDRTPGALCAPRDTPERRQDRERRLEKARRVVRPASEPIINRIEPGIGARRRLRPQLPLPVDWARLYSACMAQRPEPNRRVEIVQRRIACATFATDVIRKQR